MFAKFLTFAVVSMSLSSAFAGPKILGLICDEDRHGIKMNVDMKEKGANVIISIRDSGALQARSRLSVAAKEVAAILGNKLAKMDGKTVADKESGVELSFRVDGHDYQGNPRLAIEIRDEEGSTKLSSCNTNEASEQKMPW